MNRILFDAPECSHGQVTLQDDRADHIRTVLKSCPGDVLKTGQINGPLSEGRVLELTPEKVVLQITEGPVPVRPAVDLILALPRPKVLNRLLPQMSALGVDRLILCNASKVERYYFDTHVLDMPHIRRRLVEGLMQCGDTCLPAVRVVKQLRHFLEDDLETFCGAADLWVLHPGGESLISDVARNEDRVVLALGPEGGWLESELEGFEAHGFHRVALLNRILRSDTATVAALSAAAMKPPCTGRGHGG